MVSHSQKEAIRPMFTFISKKMFALSLGVCSLWMVTGCNHFVPRTALTDSQREVHQLNEQNNELSMAHNHSQQTLQAMLAEKEQLAQHTGQLEQQLAIATERFHNVQGERSQLKSHYISLLRNNQAGTPLGGHLAERFRNLSQKYPHFEFDPETGASKFHSEILFASGSAIVNESAYGLLDEFSKIINSPDGAGMHIMIVGHTDSKDIIKRNTARRHATNWHLSTNRASAVAVMLAKSGVDESKIRIAGHSKYQPVASNADESTRRLNRRVEIFVIAPQAAVAGWENREIRRN
ncbi:Flagellar motor rotation protein MotB [hydrothermal vent metagenome]|uniref:Flagellar motor rotation protein MotB n=1 Tax=hydrothermal vent metagenome TaxID=652676 RepID=A0A3B1DNV9_9ZZZZ